MFVSITHYFSNNKADASASLSLKLYDFGLAQAVSSEDLDEQTLRSTILRAAIVSTAYKIISSKGEEKLNYELPPTIEIKEMECKLRQTDGKVKRSLYNSSLLLCFLLSLGICAAVLPNIPFKENDTDSPRGDLTYVLTRSCLTVAMILFEIFAWYIVRKRDSFHKKQEVFWPMRCRHCANTVGLQPHLTDNDENGQAEQENIISPLSSSPDRRVNPFNEVHQLYHKPHMSLLNTFYIFGTIAGINVTIPIIANIMCLITLDNSVVINVVLVGQVLLDVTFANLILFGMLCFRNYYDAAFVDNKKFTFPLAVMFAGCFWIAAVKILYPLGELTTSKYGHVGYPCSLPGNFGLFTKRQEITLTPFYAECAIIGAAMMWQMWYSTLPEALLKKAKSTTQFQSLGPTYVGPWWGTICAWLKNIYRCRKLKFLLLRSSKKESQSFVPESKDRKDSESREPPLNITLTVAFYVFLSITYFSLCQVFKYSSLGLQESLLSTEITLTYLKWFLNIVFYLPLLVMYHFRIFLTDSAKTFRPRRTVSLVSRLIGEHDRVILVSCVGIFTLNIFRFASAIGILADISRPRENTVLACYTGIFAIFQTYSAWVMTSFLVVVQRQKIVGTDQARWTLICLIYTGILNATQWAIESLEIASWVELTTFYGHTQGKVIGVLLEPLTSLYGIHSAMIAYEAYKTVRNDIQSRYNVPVKEEPCV